MALLFFSFLALLFFIDASTASPSLQQFVDKLPAVPSLKGYHIINGTFMPGALRIGMYHKKWKFHRDLPPTDVYAYGASAKRASVPGPTIEALTEIHTYVKWENHLPLHHIFKIDPTLAIANTSYGIPTVVHLHGSLSEPESDGHSLAWFTAGFKYTGPTWKKKVYHYYNGEGHSNLWYHDHAMGITRLNILAGLLGAYIIRNPSLEAPFQLPSGRKFDVPLLIFDRSFNTDGSIYVDSKGDNPNIHPEWQPEYFGDVIIVNGKAWPYLHVRKRKYRFRIINASNARFFQFGFDDKNLYFTQIGSDAFYLQNPMKMKHLLLGPSEIADVVIDFSHAASREVVMINNASYPFPDGDPVNERIGKVMKFIVDKRAHKADPSKIPLSLVPFRKLEREEAVMTRYITLYEFSSNIDEPTHSLINFLPFEAPATETPKQGTTELWHIINLTDDNHPLHFHLVGIQVQSEVQLNNDTDHLGECLQQFNSAEKCLIWAYVIRQSQQSPVPSEAGWKNVYKVKPHYLTSILIHFDQINFQPFPFNVSAEPGYVYHCHILEHEDNNMMRPLKILP